MRTRRRRAGDAVRGQSAKPKVVCGQGPAPAGATIAHYREHLGLDIVPGTGLLPACIPGTFETFMMVLRDYGTLRLRDVLEPAIGYAENGHPLVERACATIRHRRATSSASTGRPRPPCICRAARCPRPARCSPTSARRDLRAHPQGGRSRRRRARGGDRAGAARLEPGLRRRGDRRLLPQHRSHGRQRPAPQGRADRRRTWRHGCRPSRSPCTSTTATIACSSRTPGRKGPWCCRCWRCSRASTSTGSTPTDPEFIHIWVECAKLAYADREAFYGDPKFVDVPMQTLLSEAYNAERRKLVGERPRWSSGPAGSTASAAA